MGTMTLHDLENAVTGLSPDELARFRAWFAEYDGELWDQQIEADARAGRLDALADAALRAHHDGNTQEL
ncbi:hypothetical protein Pla144_01400 [Bythopirellula polymerisocia]|uniref:Uncharacterized protein n=2 Tax=Bythopirellula polymerisocia TaxID=2528003 RepID=A0A5C6D0K9_9BACT|nr:hypothetical protein Pla144_01400 [Bythopirellula polymerisocia]